jgi:hypothetical protein
MARFGLPTTVRKKCCRQILVYNNMFATLWILPKIMEQGHKNKRSRPVALKRSYVC